MKKRNQFLFGFLAITLIVCCVLIFLLRTEKGFQFSWYLVEKFLPELQVDQVSGCWLKTFKIENLSFRQEDVEVSVDTLAVSLRFKQGIVIDEVTITKPKVTVLKYPVQQDKTEQSINDTVGRISLPFKVSITSFILKEAFIAIPDQQITLSHLMLSAFWEKELITVDALSLSGLHYDQLGSSELHEHVNSVENEKVSSTANGPIKIQLQDIKLPVDVNVQSLIIHDVKIAAEGKTQRIDTAHLKAQLNQSKLTVEQFKLQSDLLALEAQIALEMVGDFPLEADIDAHLTVPEQIDESINLNLSGTLESLDLLLSLKGDITAKMIGYARLTEDHIPFELKISQLVGQFPFDKEAIAQWENTEISFLGDLAGYDLSLKTTLAGKMIPESQLDLQAKGDLEQLEWNLKWAEQEQIHLKVESQVYFAELFKAELDLALIEIDPSFWLQTLKGQLSGKVKASASLENDSLTINLAEIKLEGELNKQPVDLDSSLLLKKQNEDLWVEFNPTQISFGDNKINIDGKIASESDLDLNISANDLSQLGVGLSGQSQGEIKLNGSITNPVFDLSLKGSSLTLAEQVTVTAINIQGQGDIENNADLDIVIDQIKLSSIEPFSVKASISGNQKNHHLLLKAFGNPINFDISLIGKSIESMWQGHLAQFTGDFQQFPISLSQPIELILDQQQLRVSKHCWRLGDGSLCSQNESLIGQSGKVDWVLNNLDLSPLLTSFISKDLSLDTMLQGHFKAQWNELHSEEVDAQLTIKPGSMYFPGGVTPIELGWEQCFVKLKQINDQFRLNSKINLKRNGELVAQFELPKVLSQPIAGTLAINQIRLDFLAPLLNSFYEQFNGQINSHIKVKGTADNPIIAGDFSLTDLKATGPDSPLLIQKGSVRVNFNETQAKINGEIWDQNTPLVLKGGIDWKNQWKLALNINGEKLALKKVPEASIILSPQIALTMTPEMVDIKGRLGVPFARVSVNAIPPSAISVSDDEIIISPNHQEGQVKKLPFHINSDLVVDVGKDVKVQAMGLKADIEGKLALRFLDNQPQIFGQLLIPSGTYRAFAQSLLIQKGRLIFNGPADQPFLDVEAIRDPKAMEDDDITAGIRVSGLANKPSIVIFSDPPLAQQNALSYILTGKSIDSGMDANAAMTLMLVNMGLAKSNQVVGNLGESIGIKELALDAEGAGDESQVSISGYIAPGLQVKYGVGLFQKLAEFTVRYEFLKDYFIESISSDEDTSVDVLHQFTF